RRATRCACRAAPRHRRSHRPRRRRGPQDRGARSLCRLPPTRPAFAVKRSVEYRERRTDAPLAAVLIGYFRLDIFLRRAVIERLYQLAIALGYEAPPHLLRAGEFAVIRVEFLVENDEAPNLRPRHQFLARQ